MEGGESFSLPRLIEVIMKKFKNLPKKKKIIFITSLAILLIIILLGLFLLRGCDSFSSVPTLTIESPQKKSITDHDPFTLDMTISDFGDSLYPAASFSIEFDNSRLEFLGIEEGNLFILDNNASGKLPEWSTNTEHSNKSGIINIMYLDMTGGKYAFTKDLLAEEDNVVLRLSFRLRGSARKGDVYELNINDAVFAASNENLSLATAKDTLKVKNSKIVVGE